jgi:hypothetical protein
VSLDGHSLGEALVNTVMKVRILKKPVVCLETVRLAAFQMEPVP